VAVRYGVEGPALGLTAAAAAFVLLALAETTKEKEKRA